MRPIAFSLLIFAFIAAGQDQLGRQKERLSELQPLVGSWRGVGQPERGSTRNSWVEEAAWSWSFETSSPALVATLPNSKYFGELRLTPAEGERSFTLQATPAGGGEPLVYSGELNDEGRLILSTPQVRGDLPTRLSFRFTAGNDRLLLLMEKPAAAGDGFTRVAEVGYTRQGSGFGKTVNQRECVVTGGLGTIEVMHAGKTYYVCCTGCRDYFNANADKVLAEHAARQQAKK